jgi:anti-sigma B factor antagonist
MAHIRSRYDGDILVISIREAKVLDELLIRQIQTEILVALETSQATRVLLDFGIVSFLSSSALGMLIRCKKKSNDFKLWLKLSSIDREILKVFRIVGLNKVFEIHPDESDAFMAFRQGDGPGTAGALAKLKPAPSGDAAEQEPEADEECDE